MTLCKNCGHKIVYNRGWDDWYHKIENCAYLKKNKICTCGCDSPWPDYNKLK